ncbi:exodeoxyribonuclease I [Chromobacterium sp. ATCC 53434]|uniref:exodeoxyribonuclease I n=1 Tax=Chromobacterium sp. (strain ATCC 53434 / SC 14030) TaxID=2059672 RepID=UPI000C77E5CE|nr:exodeoxyribonuclease I [Chromobacterium sp. ATCC 53434]AUH52152.1 exodeoxyribonuclease I [Chromobacterium sp. ATCC 53434]
MSNHTFFWHDYETFGVVPRQDRPSQFAGIRTDAELNEIGEPVMLYCRPAPDYLPTLQACLLTGITPQQCLHNGVAEHEFAAVIERELATPATIGVGYNSLRFDDEVTRFLFWRNLIDPYAREWQNHCGRWDLLDLVRATYALRPNGIVWPQHEDGRVSFKLEHLSAANGLAHEAAHDALSDVRATIALARLIRQRQPKLFDYYLTLRKKDAVKVQLSLHAPQPVLHVSGMYGAERGNLAVVWPLAAHPTNANEVIVWDLAHDPAELRGLNADKLRQRMFSRAEDLPEGVARLPIKTIHINKSPFVVANLKVLSDERAAHWGVDLAAVHRHAETARALPDLSAQWRKVYQREAGEPQDVDQNLYGGFVSNNDRKVLQKMRRLSAPQLAGEMALFEDPQLAELLFRYRARNFPDTLSGDERRRWRQWCRARLGAAQPAFERELAELLATELTPPQRQLLQQVADYAATLQAQTD